MSEIEFGDPIVFRWEEQKVALGYLGRLRWRVTTENGVKQASHARCAATWALTELLKGAPVGREAVERSPIRARLVDQSALFRTDPRMSNGWTYETATFQCDLGDHERLVPFVSDLLGRVAETAWARGVDPTRHDPIGDEYAFDSFANMTECGRLCRRLSDMLTLRLRESPAPAVAFMAAMQELKALGHDLWSWDADAIWGPDYGAHHAGAGLIVTRRSREHADLGTEENVAVEFLPLGARS